jgi:hypothetical protein
MVSIFKNQVQGFLLQNYQTHIEITNLQTCFLFWFPHYTQLECRKTNNVILQVLACLFVIVGKGNFSLGI